MARLNIKINEIAALRESAGAKTPDPIHIAVIAESAGADGISIHLREDNRYCKDRDLYLLRNTTHLPLTLEIPIVDKMIDKAIEVKPDMVSFISENNQNPISVNEVDLDNDYDRLAEIIPALQQNDILTCILIEPQIDSIKKAAKLKTDYIEISTTAYSSTKNSTDQARELEILSAAASLASKLLMGVIGGRGLNYRNIKPVLDIGVFEEFSIGHSIISRALFVGMEKAVREMSIIIQD